MSTRRVVIKVGTSTLTDGSPRLNAPRMVDLARQVAAARAAGWQVVVVSSGAIAAGREALDGRALPKDIPAKQMLAAVGQPHLMARWGQLLGLYGVTVAQVLLTAQDLTSRRRYLNARGTLLGLLAQGVLPIVNENDTVATAEIRVGDNDNLSAHVAGLIDADWLLLLTDQPGLFTADPRRDPTAALIPRVEGVEMPAELWRMAGGGGAQGTGGMTTKLQAADLARRSGVAVAIVRGSAPEVVARCLAGEPVGTVFTAMVDSVEARKRYILSGVGNGVLVVDAGAASALRGGKSLLAAGVVRVTGTFDRGETVRIVSVAGKEIARGMVNYAAGDCEKLVGRKSSEIEGVLGYFYGDEVVHRSDVVLM